MALTKRSNRSAGRFKTAAAPIPTQVSPEDRLLQSYLATARITQEEAEQRRPELLEQAREWQAVEHVRQLLLGAKAEVNGAEAENGKAEAVKAGTQVAKDRWRAFLAARKASATVE